MQGLGASSLSKRGWLSDVASELSSLGNNIANAVNQLVQSLQQQANATISALLDDGMEALKEAVASANAVGAYVSNIEQDLNNAAKAVAANAKHDLDSLASMAADTIKNFTDLLQKYGEGDFTCVSNYSGNITSVIGTSGKFWSLIAIAKITAEVKEINDTAKSVVANAKQALFDLKDVAESKIEQSIAELKNYGEGAYGCVSYNRDNITSVIETSGKF